jgi:hypothetical protein
VCHIAVEVYRFERVPGFIFLGWIINDDDSIDDDNISEEITHRMKKGNRTYYAYKSLIASILIYEYNKRKN